MRQFLFPVVTCIIFTLFISCESGSGQSALGPKAFQQKKENSPESVLLDVRTPEEFAQGHLSGAENIDFRNESFNDMINALDPSKTYFVYCRSGSRSGQSVELMRESGFKNVYNLKGGILKWEEVGLPIEKTEH